MPPRPTLSRPPWWASPLLALALGGAAVPGDCQTVPEAALKAAYIYNFALFTEWPPQALPADDRLYLCADAASPLLPALNRLGDKLVHGRRIAVLPVLPGRAAPGRCQVSLLEPGSKAALDTGAGVLTVSDRGGDTGGAVIALVVDGEHVRFDVYTDAARRQGLSLSSKLLRLARNVE